MLYCSVLLNSPQADDYCLRYSHCQAASNVLSLLAYGSYRSLCDVNDFICADRAWCQQKRQRWWRIREAEGLPAGAGRAPGGESGTRVKLCFKWGRACLADSEVCGPQGCVNVQSEDSASLSAQRLSQHEECRERRRSEPAQVHLHKGNASTRAVRYWQKIISRYVLGFCW